VRTAIKTFLMFICLTKLN